MAERTIRPSLSESYRRALESEMRRDPETMAWRMASMAIELERYGEAIVKISDALPNVNQTRVIIAGLADPPDG